MMTLISSSRVNSPASFGFSFKNSSTTAEEISMAPVTPPQLRRSYTVDEEYARVLRTKSYIDIWSKAHQQLRRSNSSATLNFPSATTPSHDEEGDNDGDQPKTSTRAVLSRSHYSRLTDFLLEPVQKASIDSNTVDAAHLHLRSLLYDYFEATAQACGACSALLASIDNARIHHRTLRRLLLNLDQSPATANFSDLSDLLNLDNPLSSPKLSLFRKSQALFSPLLRRLVVNRRRIKRRIKIIKISKKASVQVITAAFGAAAVAALAVATHAVALVGVVPVVLACPQSIPKLSWLSKGLNGFNERWLQGVAAWVDAAARGAYIVARDMDTVSIMVKRAEGEVEHDREVGRMVAECEGRDDDDEQQHRSLLVKEVAREVDGDDKAFDEQMGELEKHVYLCLLTINRSRRLVTEEMGKAAAISPRSRMCWFI